MNIAKILKTEKITVGKVNDGYGFRMRSSPARSSTRSAAVPRGIKHKHDNWFRRVKSGFETVTRPFAGKPIMYVEIGCWAGSSCEWAARNLLTHPESQGIGIDPYEQEHTRRSNNCQEIKAIAAARIAETPAAARWKWKYVRSAKGLVELQSELAKPIDILYIDGQHEAHGVIQDFVLGWQLLRVGSLVIFDDVFSPRASTELWPHVRHAVVAIEIAFRGLVRPVDGTAERQAALLVERKEPLGLHDKEPFMQAMNPTPPAVECNRVARIELLRRELKLQAGYTL